MNYDWYHSSFVRELIDELVGDMKLPLSKEAKKLVDRFEEEQRQVALGMRGFSIGASGFFKQN